MKDVERRLYRVAEAGKVLSLSENAVRKLIREGHIRAVVVNNVVGVTVEAIDEYIANLTPVRSDSRT